MSASFRLHVPCDAAYRPMVAEIVARYTALEGGSSADASALASTVTAAIERLRARAAADATVDLAFHPSAASLHVEIVCGGTHETVHVPLASAAS